ncbi:natural killer cell receptor 2B4-like [Melanerpes formicivorus]|uniref:natural killer cell receptor 2B4-like n=1 Tax=Melanerpes formicivorus TaxID=211600 RepID=UPI00358E2D8B
MQLFLLLLLISSFFFLTQAGGHQECQGQDVAAPGALQLVPKQPPEPWLEVGWKLQLDTERQQRILEVRNETVRSFPGPFSGRVTFQRPKLSLQLSPTSTADSGLYLVEFGHHSGAVTTYCFHVNVWEPVPPPLLETHIVRWEQGSCNLSLLCSLPAARGISYSWSCPGAGLAGNQSRLQLEVQEGAEAVLCRCNASNPVSWVVASTDVTAACRAAASDGSWSCCQGKGVFCLLVLGSLLTAVAITHLRTQPRGTPSQLSLGRRQRASGAASDPPAGSGQQVGPQNHLTEEQL